MPKAVFLDVDNCLVWSEDRAGTEGVIPVMTEFNDKYLRSKVPVGKLQCWQSPGIVTPEDFLRSKSSTTMLELLRGVVHHGGLTLTDEDLAYWDQLESVRVCEAFEARMEPMEGAEQMLRDLRGLQQAGRVGSVSAATSSVLRRAKITLQTPGLLGWFDRVYSGQGPGWYRNGSPTGISPWKPDDPNRLLCVGEPKGKPDPAVYQLACRTEQVDPCDAATVEDSGNGVRAAKAAGIGQIIGFIGSVQPSEQEAHGRNLIAAGATCLVNHLSEVAPLFA